METFKINEYNIEVYLVQHRYIDNDRLAVVVYEKSGETFTVLTTNIDAPISDVKDCAYVDTNNNPWAIKFIVDNNLAAPTGKLGHSGYCTYPEFKFDLNRLGTSNDE